MSGLSQASIEIYRKRESRLRSIESQPKKVVLVFLIIVVVAVFVVGLVVVVVVVIIVGKRNLSLKFGPNLVNNKRYNVIVVVNCFSLVIVIIIVVFVYLKT